MQIEVMQIQIEVHSRRRPGILYSYQHPIIVFSSIINCRQPSIILT